jgi:hypothetical protein
MDLFAKGTLLPMLQSIKTCDQIKPAYTRIEAEIRKGGCPTAEAEKAVKVVMSTDAMYKQVFCGTALPKPTTHFIQVTAHAGVLKNDEFKFKIETSQPDCSIKAFTTPNEKGTEEGYLKIDVGKIQEFKMPTYKYPKP